MTQLLFLKLQRYLLETSLFEASAILIRDEKKAIEAGESAHQVFKANKGAVDKTLGVVETCLEAISK